MKISLSPPLPEYLKPTADEPDEEDLAYWISDGVCEATDGCSVEPDGICAHGHVSWLLYLGWL